MKRAVTFALSTLGLLLLGTSTEARLNLGQRTFAEKQDRYFARSIKKVNRICGTRIDAMIDWESFKGEVDKMLNRELSKSFYSFCAQPLDTMAYLCTKKSGGAKVAIAAQIKSYRCKFGGRTEKGKSKRALALKDGALTMWVDWKATNYGRYILSFFDRELERARPK